MTNGQLKLKINDCMLNSIINLVKDPTLGSTLKDQLSGLIFLSITGEYWDSADDNKIIAPSKSHLEYHRDIEYVRTDVFIEKACEWLKESITNNPECNRIISKKGVITMGLLIEDFKKYMKA